MISYFTSAIQPAQGAALVGLFALLFFAILSFNNRRSGLSKIPGPFIAQYTDAWSLWAAWKTSRDGNRVSLYRSLQAKYGDVVRTGPRSVTVLDPRAVPVIYGVKSKLAKGNAYIPFRQSGVTTSLLSIQDEKTHSKYRKLVANAYSMSSLKGYEPYVDDMVNRFVEVCDEHAKRKEPMNISLWCHYYCFDVVSKITMGSPIGCLEGKDALGLIKLVKGFRAYAGIVSQVPWLDKIFRDNALLRKTKPSPFIKLVQGKVQDRLRNPDPEDQPRPDLLSHFVATHGTYPELMTQKQVAISTSGNMIAGGLSPAVTFDELCHYLATHPESQDKLYSELQQAECNFPASFDRVQHLPYLEGVVREAYRMHQSTSSSLQRVTGPSGLDLPNGFHMPPGTNIGSPAGAINQDRGVFGLDADVYKPERWMQGKGESDEAYAERRKVMDRTELSFGQGSRTCIGKNIVALEMFKVVATLMGQFKFQEFGESRRSKVYVTVHRREKV